MPINQVQLYTEPNRPQKKDLLDKILAGVNIANSIVGIGTSLEGTRQRRQELGLQEQQTKAQTDYLGAQTEYMKQKPMLDQTSNDYKQRMESEKEQKSLLQDFAKEVGPFKTKFSEIEGSYGKILNAAKNEGKSGLNQVAALYGFIKTLDPGSVVRPGEIDLTKSATPVSQQLGIIYEQFKSGKVLPRSVMEDIVKIAGLAYEEEQKSFSDRIGDVKSRAETLGLEPKYIDAISFVNPRYKAGEQFSQLFPESRGPKNRQGMFDLNAQDLKKLRAPMEMSTEELMQEAFGR